MTTETLLAIIAPIWVLLLVGLWRLAGRIEHIDRRISESLDRLGPRHG